MGNDQTTRDLMIRGMARPGHESDSTGFLLPTAMRFRLAPYYNPVRQAG